MPYCGLSSISYLQSVCSPPSNHTKHFTTCFQLREKNENIHLFDSNDFYNSLSWWVVTSLCGSICKSNKFHQKTTQHITYTSLHTLNCPDTISIHCQDWQTRRVLSAGLVDLATRGWECVKRPDTVEVDIIRDSVIILIVRILASVVSVRISLLLPFDEPDLLLTRQRSTSAGEWRATRCLTSRWLGAFSQPVIINCHRQNPEFPSAVMDGSLCSHIVKVSDPVLILMDHSENSDRLQCLFPETGLHHFLHERRRL